MIINVSGTSKQVEISQTLQHYVRENTESEVKKYFDHAVSANIHFSKDAYFFKCEIIVNRGEGHAAIITANDSDKDIFHAFNLALAHIKNRLRKYRNRLKKHHSDKEELQNALTKATLYEISPNNEELSHEEEGDSPAVIAETKVSISSLTVSEAVIRMDLMGLKVLMFKNRANGRINVVYYHDDGNIHWIDPNIN